MGSTMLKIYVIIAASMYMVVTMAYVLEFAVTHPGGGWGMDRIIDYALLWPARLI